MDERGQPVDESDGQDGERVWTGAGKRAKRRRTDRDPGAQASAPTKATTAIGADARSEGNPPNQARTARASR
jgi:hypothetical protein